MSRITVHSLLPLVTFMAGLFISSSVSRSYEPRSSDAFQVSSGWTDQQIRDYLRDVHSASQELERIRKIMEEQAKKRQ